jgi:putative hydrolase of the HAD superfamily
VVAIRNVIFDFGGVLVEWRPHEIIDAFYAEPELREAIHTLVFQHEDWVAMDRGTIDELTAVRRFAVRMARPEAEMHALLAHVRESLKPIGLHTLRFVEYAGVALRASAVAARLLRAL